MRNVYVRLLGSGAMKKAPAYVLLRLKAFAKAHGFHVTSGSGGKHNEGSLHLLWRAVDLRTRDKTDAEVAAFKRAARRAGYRVLDERKRPKGQKLWGGPHLHCEDRADYPEAG
jgi:hypothetical protein